MNILITAATPKEISPLVEQLQNKLLNTDILITGVGLVASTYSVQKQIQIKRPDIIIQAGIAGCFDHDFELGSVVAISKDRIADEGVIEKGKFKPIQELGLSDPNMFPYQNGWLVNSNIESLNRTGLPTVRAISINNISTLPQTIEAYKNMYFPVTESMEGASFHYVCLMENIPFLQLRGISNYIGERDKTKWQLNTSIKNLNTELLRLLQLLH